MSERPLSVASGAFLTVVALTFAILAGYCVLSLAIWIFLWAWELVFYLAKWPGM